MYKIRNWKLALLACCLMIVFCALGYWQLSRAKEKQLLLAEYAARTKLTPLTISELIKPNNDLNFYRIRLTGHFDNQHTFYLDNKIFHGQIGYEIYTPFKVTDTNLALLIDRGFVPIMSDRNHLPTVPAILGKKTIEGMLRTPPQLRTWATIDRPEPITGFPMRVQYLDVNQLSQTLHYSLYPYLIQIEPSSSFAFPIEWSIVVMGPEKHIGYAIQWFAFALTLLILFVALNRPPKTKGGQ